MCPQRELPPLLEVADRAEWRAWLERNHATSQAVRLAIGKKGGTATALTYDDAVEEALAFGWIDSTAYRLDEQRYSGIFTPRRRGSIWSRPNKSRVAHLTEAGLMAPAGLATVEAAKADGSWQLLDDVDALRLPHDLVAALDAEELRAAFDALARSTQQQLLYGVLSAKRPETRVKRIATALDAARANHAPAD